MNQEGWLLAIWAVLVLFLEQDIIVVGRGEPVDRATRRRLQRERWEPLPLVRVVRLRRVLTRGRDYDEEPGRVDWACQWVVRPHWRRQWFPSANEHRPLWILPHVKGPEDKPLKPPRATVFAVVR